mmetsp:Transcript_22458/g.39163  ORF Transcript_22458/g.39163 Transcript_22458/m.39163 type:complete len:307 (+) Transcript_22458:77-997(+)
MKQTSDGAADEKKESPSTHSKEGPRASTGRAIFDEFNAEKGRAFLGKCSQALSESVEADRKMWRFFFAGMIGASAISVGVVVFKQLNRRFIKLSDIPVSHFRMQRSLRAYVSGIQQSKNSNDTVLFLQHLSLYQRLKGREGRSKMDLLKLGSLPEGIPCRLYGVNVVVPDGSDRLRQMLQFRQTTLKAKLLYLEEKPEEVAVCKMKYSPSGSRLLTLKRDVAEELTGMGLATIRDEVPIAESAGHSLHSSMKFAKDLERLYQKQHQAQRNNRGIWKNRNDIEIGDSAASSFFWKIYRSAVKRIGNK